MDDFVHHKDNPIVLNTSTELTSCQLCIMHKSLNRSKHYLILLHDKPGHLQTFQTFEGYFPGEHFPKHLDKQEKKSQSSERC